MENINLIILAGGEGVRMDSELPKPLIKVGRKSMLERVIYAGKEINPDRILVVVRDKRLSKAAQNRGCNVVWQKRPLGTADALKSALPKCDKEGDIIVTCGDIPFIKGEIFNRLLKEHRKKQNYITILTSTIDNPYGYGRIVKQGNKVIKIVEEKEATRQEKKIDLVNSGIYAVNRKGLESYINKIKKSPKKGEYYLTDLIEIAADNGLKVGEYRCDPSYIMGINTKKDLQAANKKLKKEKQKEI
ncbi:MAG: sugar phosphate nucleotidyltransferase [Elusimicrobiota bacterium]